MENQRNLSDFFSELLELFKSYSDLKLRLYRLKIFRETVRVGGILMWMLVSLFIFFLVIIFVGITMGFWFSSLVGSRVGGFGLATLLLIIIFLLLSFFRKRIFINPMIRIFLKQYKDAN